MPLRIPRPLAAVNAHRGFTLIELLITVAILGVLGALTMPVIWMVRDQAESTRCLGNLRQYAVIIDAYTADNRGYAPLGYCLSGGGIGNPTNNYRGVAPYWATWCSYFEGGTAGDQVMTRTLCCPAANRQMNVTGKRSCKPNTNVLADYPDQAPFRLSRAVAPARTMQMHDAGIYNLGGSQQFGYANGTFYPLLLPHRRAATWVSLGSGPENNGRGNGYFQDGQETVLFLDGHGEMLPLDAGCLTGRGVPQMAPGSSQPARGNYGIFWNNTP